MSMYPALLWLSCSLSDHFFHGCSGKVLPVPVGSRIRNLETKHFISNISLFRHRNGSRTTHLNYEFRPYRFAVGSFPFLSPPCLPSWTSKNLANMCIIATGGLLERLQKCMCRDFDGILMFPPPFWGCFCLSHIIFIIPWYIWLSSDGTCTKSIQTRRRFQLYSVSDLRSFEASKSCLGGNREANQLK